jgi:hypothetical protein
MNILPREMQIEGNVVGTKGCLVRMQYSGIQELTIRLWMAEGRLGWRPLSFRMSSAFGGRPGTEFI